MPFVRVCRTTHTSGRLLAPDAVDEYIHSHDGARTDPWYVGTYVLSDEAQNYFKENGNTIKGYKGEAWAEQLYWDLDDKDLEKARADAEKLVSYIGERYDIAAGLEIYFSGSKGFHVIIRTSNKLSEIQLRRITAKIAREADVQGTFDSAVYNVTRILRYPNTRHEKSGLWKIPLAPVELSLPVDAIRKLAEKPRSWDEANVYPGIPINIDELLSDYDTDDELVVDDNEDTQSALSEFRDLISDAPYTRRCIDILQAGNYGPGERENALIRLAAFYKGVGLTEDEVYERLNDSLAERAKKFTDLNPYSDADTLKCVKQVFSASWKGGMFSCKSDQFLISKCSNGGTCCMAPRKTKSIFNEHQYAVGGLLKDYIVQGDEAIKEFPKTGLVNLDHYVKIRPRNISIIAGAPGSGKTSLLLEIMDSLNRQRINHILFSLDMASTSLFEMMAVRFTNYTATQIEQAFSAKSRNKKLMWEIAERLHECLPYSYFDVSTAVDLNHVEHTLEKFNSNLEAPIQVAFVDYAGRLIGDGDSYTRASNTALKANDIAKVTKCHLMFVAQTSRDVGDHTTPIYSNRVSKDSSEWEANATFVISVWRPFGTGIEADDRYMNMFIGKNRSGKSRELYFQWHGARRRIIPLTPAELIEYSDLCQKHNKPLPSQYETERAQEVEEARRKLIVKENEFQENLTQHNDAIKSATANRAYENTSNNQKEVRNHRPSKSVAAVIEKRSKRS